MGKIWSVIEQTFLDLEPCAACHLCPGGKFVSKTCDGKTPDVTCTNCSSCDKFQHINVSCGGYEDVTCAGCSNMYNGTYSCFNSSDGPFETGSVCTGATTADTQTCSAQEPDSGGKSKKKLALALGLGLGLGLPAAALIAYCSMKKKDKRQVLETRLME